MGVNERKSLVKLIQDILATEIPVAGIARKVERIMRQEVPGSTRMLRRAEQIMNTEIPGTGSRVLYVAMPGRGKTRKAISSRATEVLTYLRKQRKATAADLMKALDVNRNVIAGAVYELRQAGLIKSQATGVLVESAAGSGRKR